MVDGLHRFGDGYVNWYLAEGDDGVTAIDAGFPHDWRQLTAGLERLGRPLSDLRAVVLTHGHIDHVGFARRAQREAGAAVWVHEGDAPLIRSPFNVARSARGPLRYANHAPARRLLLHAIASGAPLSQRIRDYRTFSPGEALPVPGNPVPVFTPGHTDGHCAMHFPDRDALVSGDALVTYEPYTGRTGPSIVAKAATKDSEQALRSLDAIEATGASVLGPGHGDPWTNGAAEAARVARAAGPA
jgi:glyoxylase-like metal-dependent hydrolase (beta-lactamase superfamily II)